MAKSDKSQPGGKRQVGISLPPEVHDELAAFRQDSGVFKWRIVAAGILALRLCPLDLRHHLISGDEDAAKAWFDQAQSDRAYRQVMDTVAETQAAQGQDDTNEAREP